MMEGQSWYSIIDNIVKRKIQEHKFFLSLDTNDVSHHISSTPIKPQNGMYRRRRRDDASSPGDESIPYCSEISLENSDRSLYDQLKATNSSDTISFVDASLASSSSNAASVDKHHDPDRRRMQIPWLKKKVADINGSLHMTQEENEILANRVDVDDSVDNALFATPPVRHIPNLSAVTVIPRYHHSPFVADSRTVRNRSRSKSPTSNRRNLFKNVDDEEKFTFFFTKKYPFSNHYPCTFKINERLFNCTEQYYMYKKAEQFNDLKAMDDILTCDDPKRMKVIGSSINGFKQKDWDRESEKIMFLANFEKYKQNKKLRYALFATEGTTLVETNPSDQRWGIGLSMDDERASNRSTWRGRNLCGRILTSIREVLAMDPTYSEDLAMVRRKPKKHLWWKSDVFTAIKLLDIFKNLQLTNVRLLLGEGNFSFARSFVEKHPSEARCMIATEHFCYKYLENYENGKDNVEFLIKMGVLVLFNFDATRIRESFNQNLDCPNVTVGKPLHLNTELFSRLNIAKQRCARIHFSCPRSMNEIMTKNLIRKFLDSANEMQNVDDKLYVCLPKSATTFYDYLMETSQKQFGFSLNGLNGSARCSFYRYKCKRKFKTNNQVRYPKYVHTTFKPNGHAVSAKIVREHVFEKSLTTFGFERTQNFHGNCFANFTTDDESDSDFE